MASRSHLERNAVFWGDALLIPRPQMRQKQQLWGRDKRERARIPYALAHAVALTVRHRG